MTAAVLGKELGQGMPALARKRRVTPANPRPWKGRNCERG
jgi:hypothetical protein